MKIRSMYFGLTDSKVVLGYISNEARKFHIFVANRIQVIRSFSHPSQWHYVKTGENPADFTSRGMSINKILVNKLWWHGPEFLKSPEATIANEIRFEVQSSDPEVKRIATMTTKANPIPDSLLLQRLETFSSWMSARRAIAVCLRLKEKLQKHISNQHDNTTKYEPVCVDELQNAEKLIMKEHQRAKFPKEINQLSQENNNGLKKDSCLLKLDPFLDDQGLLRVGGRIRRSSLNHGVISPVIIHKNCHIAQLLVQWYHKLTGHSGANFTLGELRAAGYWIIKGRSLAKSVIDKCVICKQLRGRSQKQRMADLPEDRLEPCPPFTYSAVDLFGPFLVREGRSEKKRWGVMFVCMVTRAVHIEVATSMSTDSFINAYRRFISRRGPIRQLRCDRGTNFVGARNELNDEKVKHKLRTSGCDFDYFEFKMNFPHSSHMGGVWERMIRSARAALSSILISHPGTLDDELLHTFMIEAEAIVNSRPLTYVDMNDPHNSEPLTPAQILTLKNKVVMPPPGEFVKQDLFCRKRWRKVQYLADQFWQRWLREFLPTLQERQKWHRKEDNLKVNDIVLVIDELSPRSQWPKGKVLETFESSDDLVRKVRVKTQEAILERPVHKLVFLFRPDSDD